MAGVAGAHESTLTIIATHDLLAVHTECVYSPALILGGRTIVRQRINITLPEETIAVIDRLAKKVGVNRSRFLDQAARYYVQAMGKSSLKKLLVEGAIVRAKENRAIAEDWFPADAEAWARLR